jgi:hypothetical protein
MPCCGVIPDNVEPTWKEAIKKNNNIGRMLYGGGDAAGQMDIKRRVLIFISAILFTLLITCLLEQQKIEQEALCACLSGSLEAPNDMTSKCLEDGESIYSLIQGKGNPEGEAWTGLGDEKKNYYRSTWANVKRCSDYQCEPAVACCVAFMRDVSSTNNETTHDAQFVEYTTAAAKSQECPDFITAKILESLLSSIFNMMLGAPVAVYCFKNKKDKWAYAFIGFQCAMGMVFPGIVSAYYQTYGVSGGTGTLLAGWLFNTVLGLLVFDNLLIVAKWKVALIMGATQTDAAPASKEGEV